MQRRDKKAASLATALTRRRFVSLGLAGATLGTALAAATHRPLTAGVLYGPTAGEHVARILKTYLGLGPEHRGVLHAFTRSLTHRPAHTASPAESRAILSGDRGTPAMERYVVQEFIASTTFLAWSRGRASNLTLLSS